MVIIFAISSALLDLLVKAAAALPLIAALSLVAGRRGNGAFTLWGGKRLLALALLLAWAGPLWLAAGYLAETLHYGGSWDQILAPLLAVPGLPWSSACGVWLVGWLCIAVACSGVSVCAKRLAEDRYRLRFIRLPLSFCLLAVASFFAAFILINWPFAGLPEGLDWERASMAVFRHASRNYFMALCPAGAIALLSLLVHAPALDAEHGRICVRWLAFWAVAGALPYTLVTWGSLVGLGFNANASIGQGFRPQAYGLLFLTGALASWAFILWKPHLWRTLALAGIILLLLKTFLPIIITMPI